MLTITHRSDLLYIKNLLVYDTVYIGPLAINEISKIQKKARLIPFVLAHIACFDIILASITENLPARCQMMGEFLAVCTWINKNSPAYADSCKHNDYRRAGHRGQI